MNSFAATILYGALALFAVFVTCLAGWVTTSSGAHLFAVLFSLTAIGLAYWSQGQFHAADAHLQQHQWQTQPGYSGPENPDAWNLYETAHRTGTVCQLASLGFAIGGGILFFLGG